MLIPSVAGLEATHAIRIELKTDTMFDEVLTLLFRLGVRSAKFKCLHFDVIPTTKSLDDKGTRQAIGDSRRHVNHSYHLLMSSPSHGAVCRVLTRGAWANAYACCE